MRSIAVAGVLTIAATIPGYTATLDFLGISGTNPNPVVLSNATINNLTGSTIFVFNLGFCFLDVDSNKCDGDGEITFDNAIENLNFNSSAVGPGDSAEIFAFNESISLGSIAVTFDTNLDFSGFGVITRLLFDDSLIDDFGIFYSSFSFDNVNVGTVPVPAALPLFGTGLALMGFIGWRRKRKLAAAA